MPKYLAILLAAITLAAVTSSTPNAGARGGPRGEATSPAARSGWQSGYHISLMPGFRWGLGQFSWSNPQYSPAQGPSAPSGINPFTGQPAGMAEPSNSWR